MQLVVQSGAEPGRTYDLNVGNRLSVGRQSSNEIVVSDEQVSRKHAHIELKATGVIVTDLNSSNGTFVNGTRISSVITLKPGDTLQVGTTVLKLVDNQAATTSMPTSFEPSTATLPALEFGASAYPNVKPVPPPPPASSGSKGIYDSPPQAAPAYGYNPPAPAQPAYGQADQVVPPPPMQPSLGQAPAYGQPPQPSLGQAPAYGQPQAEASYPQHGYDQPQQAPAYGQPAYGQPTQASGYPQQAAYAQPQPNTGRKANPLLIIALVAIAALVLIGGGIFFFLGSSSDLPLPNNSTKIDISSADQPELVKNLKNTNYTFYTSKDKIDDLKVFYGDKMKAKGYSLDARTSSTSNTGQLVFINGDKAALVLLVRLDQNSITQWETAAASFKGKLKEGDTLVGLAEGKTSTIT